MPEFLDGQPDGGPAMGLDLFGEPVRAARGPGRPPHVPTAENRAFVSMMFVCGHKPMDVAKAMGLKKSAFYAYYKTEIMERAVAALKYRGRQLLRLHAKAETGDVSAEKALTGMIQAEQLRTAGTAFADKPAAPRKGVKEQRQDDAWDAGRGDPDWSDLLHSKGGASLPN